MVRALSEGDRPAQGLVRSRVLLRTRANAAPISRALDLGVGRDRRVAALFVVKDIAKIALIHGLAAGFADVEMNALVPRFAGHSYAGDRVQPVAVHGY